MMFIIDVVKVVGVLKLIVFCLIFGKGYVSVDS